jgi:uncharacterized membrane protein
VTTLAVLCYEYLLNMKASQFYISMLLAGLSVILAISLILLGRSNGQIQQQLAAQQVEINRGSTANQVGVELLRDMGNVAVQNDAMRELLKKNGFTLNTNNNANTGAR